MSKSDDAFYRALERKQAKRKEFNKRTLERRRNYDPSLIRKETGKALQEGAK